MSLLDRVWSKGGGIGSFRSIFPPAGDSGIELPVVAILVLSRFLKESSEDQLCALIDVGLHLLNGRSIAWCEEAATDVRSLNVACLSLPSPTQRVYISAHSS